MPFFSFFSPCRNSGRRCLCARVRAGGKWSFDFAFFNRIYKSVVVVCATGHFRVQSPWKVRHCPQKKKKKVSQRGREKLSVIFYSFPETLQLVLPREIVPRGFAFPPALPTRGRFRRCVGGGSGCAAPRALQLRAAQRGGDGERGPARGTLRGAPRVRSGRATRAKKIIITINNTFFN